MDARLTRYNLKISAAAFKIWGAVIVVKGLFDLISGEPEANLFSPEKWQFVTYAQWLRWGGFELTYGLFCAAFGYFLGALSRYSSVGLEESRKQEHTV